MSDPLSIASGVAGLVSLGLTICLGLNRYLDDIKGQGADISSASSQLGSLQLILEGIQQCQRRLGSDHAQTVKAVTSCLGLCEDQLKTLGTILNRLGPKTSSPDQPKNKLKNLKSSLVYPFKRQDLVRVEDQLTRTTTTLCLALQVLALSVETSVSDNIEKFSLSVHNASLSTKESLEKIERNVGRLDGLPALIEGMVKSAHGAISTRHDRMLDELTFRLTEQSMQMAEVLSAIQSLQKSPRLIESDTSLVVGRQVSDNPDAVWQNSVANFPGSVSDVPKCSCWKFQRRSYGVIRQESRPIGPFTYVWREEISGRHRPGCALYSLGLLQQSTTREFQLTGFTSALSRFICLSLNTVLKSASHYSIAPNLRVARIVRTRDSPAFQLVRSRKYELFSWARRSNPRDAETLNSIRFSLHNIYASRMASPTDIDENGYNIAHRLVEVLYSFVKDECYVGNALIALRSLLQYLYEIGVDLNATTFPSTSSVRPSSRKVNRSSTVLGQVDLSRAPHIAQLYGLLDDVIPDTPYFIPNRASKRLDQMVIGGIMYVEFTSRRLDIAEASFFASCPTLGMAILRRSEPEVRVLLESRALPSLLLERGPYGETAFHLCSIWPQGLRLLISCKEAHGLINVPDRHSVEPVLYALFLSGKICKEKDPWKICNGCDCSACIQLLLTADCAVPIARNIGGFLSRCSFRARRLFLEHLKNRLQRLRALAEIYLPREDLEWFRFPAIGFVDASKRKLLVRMMEGRIPLPGALVDNSHTSHPPLFYEALRGHRMAKLAWRIGFRELDAENEAEVMWLARNEHIQESWKDCAYYYYLRRAREGTMADVLSPLGLPAVHHIARELGLQGGYRYRRRLNIWPSDVAATQLYSVVFNSKEVARIPCPCSVDGNHSTADAMFASLGFLASRNRFDVILCSVRAGQWLSTIVDTPRGMRSSLFRFITMQKLDIHHTCHIYWRFDEEGTLLRNEAEQLVLTRRQECEEMMDEIRDLVDELDILVHEFEEEYEKQNVGLEEFVTGYWTTRMEEVKRQWSEPLSAEGKQSLREIGVVLEEAEDE